MNTIIIENNVVWRDTLETYVNNEASLKLIGSFKSILEAYHIMQTERVDLIFFNMDMMGATTLDFSKGLNKSPLIIFSKPERGNAIKTGNSIIVDVLTQPLVLEHFQKAIEKAERWVESDKKEDFFFIRANNSFVKLLYADVLYIKALENFVQIVTKKETFTKLVSLKKILHQLPNDIFVQVHRSFIINLQEVISIEKDGIAIEGLSIPIGNAFKEALLKKIVQKRLILR